MSTVTTRDGNRIYYKDRGTGRPVEFIHGWPLHAASTSATRRESWNTTKGGRHVCSESI
jgi:hypothetical protein